MSKTPRCEADWECRRDFDQLSNWIKNIDQSLQQVSNNSAKEVSGLQELEKSLSAAASLTESLSSNQYFDIRQAVSDFYTGRDSLLEELRATMVPPPGILRGQRRFIIYGLGGSGKTQFCCKFAADTRERCVLFTSTTLKARARYKLTMAWTSFWGIFWVDASTETHIQQSMASIAFRAEWEQSKKDSPRALHLLSDIDRETAALEWLSSLNKRWLLIIDNADSTEPYLTNFLDKVFRGNRGNILVTTRNRQYSRHGNVGRKCFDFGGDSQLKPDEATQLLLKTSDVTPDLTKKSVAQKIVETLGYLALAIVQAGSAIREGPLAMESYIRYYMAMWHSLRKNQDATKPDAKESVFTTWEISYKSLDEKQTDASKDAIELLFMFAYFHRENIPRSLLDRSISNKKVEDEQEKQSSLSRQHMAERDVQTQGSSWSASQVWRLLSAAVQVYRGPPALPGLIREARETSCDEEEDEFNYRLDDALKELTSHSLITFNRYNKTYSMHPIVHTWARERRKLKLADQCLWANVAGMVLSASILLPLPPVKTTTDEDEYLVSLLPHVEQVQAFQHSLEEKMDRRARPLWRKLRLMIVPRAKDANEMRMLVKFSIVFAKSGRWRDAEVLLIKVKDFLYSTVGPKDEKFRTITAFLSEVYFRMGKAPKAVELQQEILQSCQEHLGTDHPDTFRARDRLGCTKWLQGRFTEARKHQEIAVEGFKMLPDVGTNHEYKFEAMDNLGRTIGKFWETHHFEQAYDLHHEAVQGLSKVLGPDHDKTLTAKESLCRVALVLRAKRKHTFNPLELITEVVETRKVNFGKEHPLTLLATANLVIAKMEAGHLEEAERMVREGLEVAIRTLGADYYGTIHGRDILGCVLIQQGRYAEAEEVFIHVVESQKRLEIRRGDYHPERLASLIQLAKVIFRQGRVEESIRVCEETIEGLEIISKAPHPLRAGMIRARDQMLPLLSSSRHNGHGEVEFPWILFPGGP